jgi:transposase-like protein
MADRKQTFTPEFRAEAVRLAQTSGRSQREVVQQEQPERLYTILLDFLRRHSAPR